MNALNMNDVANVTINDVRFAIHKFRGFTSVRVGATALAVLSPAAPLLGAVAGFGDEADVDIGKALSSLGPALAALDADRVEMLARELTEKNGNVFYERDSKPLQFTESSIDELFGGDISHLFELMKEVITLNFSGLFTWLGTLFGKDAEEAEEQTESLV